MTVAPDRRMEKLFHLFFGFFLILGGFFLLFVGQLELGDDLEGCLIQSSPAT